MCLCYRCCLSSLFVKLFTEKYFFIVTQNVVNKSLEFFDIRLLLLTFFIENRTQRWYKVKPNLIILFSLWKEWKPAPHIITSKTTSKCIRHFYSCVKISVIISLIKICFDIENHIFRKFESFKSHMYVCLYAIIIDFQNDLFYFLIFKNRLEWYVNRWIHISLSY